MRKAHGSKLRADFRQYYHCSFDELVKTSAIEASELMLMLPRGSRFLTELDPELAWRQEHYLLASIANSLSVLVWQNSKDGAKGKNKPKPIEPPTKKKKPTNPTYTAAEYERLLSMPRREVS